mgnify:CR=1 FL=1
MGTFYKIIFSCAFLALAPFSAYAASLNFSPPSGSYGVGSTFSVNVSVGSSNQAMNAASGVVSFPWDKLEVVSISKQGSIISLWTAEPSFSNSQGTVSFEGIVLNPGYTGASGKILTITFKARGAGTANVSFSSGSILANDGTGTNILDGMRVAVFTLTAADAAPAPKSSDVAPAPKSEEPVSMGDALGIMSVTHPDQEEWYADNTPEFAWNLPKGALEVRTLIGTSPSATPSVSYVPAIAKKKTDELPDGTYYFSLRVRTAGGWSPVSRYRVNIDTTPPKPFSITFPHGNKGWDPQPVVFFNTTDGESGVSHYEIKIGEDDKPLRSAPETFSNPHALPERAPGNYTLLVTAADRAGNVRTASSEFTIEGIDPPTITYYTETMEEGDILKIRGTTYPNSDVTIHVREGDVRISEEYARSNPEGDFVTVITQGLDSGTYTFTARVKDDRGAQSVDTLPLTVSVKSVKSKLLPGIVGSTLKYLFAAILILLILGGLAWVGMRVRLRVPRTIVRMRRKVREADRTTARAFKVLREGVARHVTRLKKTKRKLTKEEMGFLEELKDKLEEAEEVITREIKDISKS